MRSRNESSKATLRPNHVQVEVVREFWKEWKKCFMKVEKNVQQKHENSPAMGRGVAQHIPWHNTATAMQRGISSRVGAFG